MPHWAATLSEPGEVESIELVNRGGAYQIKDLDIELPNGNGSRTATSVRDAKGLVIVAKLEARQEQPGPGEDPAQVAPRRGCGQYADAASICRCLRSHRRIFGLGRVHTGTRFWSPRRGGGRAAAVGRGGRADHGGSARRGLTTRPNRRPFCATASAKGRLCWRRQSLWPREPEAEALPHRRPSANRHWSSATRLPPGSDSFSRRLGQARVLHVIDAAVPATTPNRKPSKSPLRNGNSAVHSLWRAATAAERDGRF